MTTPNIKLKLNLIFRLFSSIICDKDGIRIDNETITGLGYWHTRAYHIAVEYLQNNKQPSRDDLIYMNKTIKKLIEIVGTDTKNLKPVYFESLDEQSMGTEWINDYLFLLKITYNTVRR